MNLRTVAAGFSAALFVVSAGAAFAAPRSSAAPGGPGEADVMHAGTGDRAGFLVWDQGAPDLVSGNEMTLWNQGENFSIPNATVLTDGRFWTGECGAFDGSFQWAIWEDAGGSPGAFVASGAPGLGRGATGRFAFGCPEFENTFSFGGVVLNPGNYYLTLHMSADCGTRDEIYWETSAIVVAPAGVEDDFCDGGFPSNGQEHAFQLFGKPACDPPAAPNNPLPQTGSTDVPTNTLLRWNVPCFVGNLQNPGFESGDFTGWNPVSNIPPGGELTPWNVSSGGTGWFGSAYPFQGSFYAQNGFDGGAGLSYELFQDVFVPPAASAVLTWRDRIQWDSLGIGSSQPRLYRVTIQPAGGGAPLATIYSFDIVMNGAPYSDTGYVTHNVDLAALGLTGQALRVHWFQYIPEEYTGPAQFEIDAVELDCEAAGTPPPSKEVSAARRTLSDEAFAAKVAMYQAVKKGEFRSPAEAIASGRFNPPASKSALSKTPSAETDPLNVSPERGVGTLLFDGGSPDLSNGNEMTQWLQTEDFDASSDSVVHFVRFWTLENAGWDGTCEISFHPEIGFSPGPAYFVGTGSLVSRTATGRSNFGLAEVEYVFAIPGGAFVPQGRNWLGLHMSADCGTRDDVYWETTSNGFGFGGLELFNCTDAASNNGTQHAFQLYGEDAECPVTYDVYLRRLPYENFQLVCQGTPLPVCDPGRLGCESDYEWVVVAYNGGGQTVGPYWTFSTAVCCCPGDANGDRTVNFADITKVLENWLLTCP